MAKYKIKWSIEARLDLIDILEFYIKRNGNSVFSKKLNTIIKQGLFQISKNPFIGIKTQFDFDRVLITSEYQIVYEIIDDVILVVMIWDCRRNPDDKRIGRKIM